MAISRSAGYAMMAAGHVALYDKDGPVLASAISKEYDIPLEYLLKILQQLVRANVMRSKRGPRGGFTLARRPEEITILEIIEAVNGPLCGYIEVAAQANNAPYSVKMEQACKTAGEKCVEVLGKAKLADML
ncbi:MAG: Rrf2 family transcriptional regulator [Phycisphaerae bacterium]|nr:Rrf2 family transcriptional regulator [Phycisphaerae bacterium]